MLTIEGCLVIRGNTIRMPNYLVNSVAETFQNPDGSFGCRLIEARFLCTDLSQGGAEIVRMSTQRYHGVRKECFILRHYVSQLANIVHMMGAHHALGTNWLQLAIAATSNEGLLCMFHTRCGQLLFNVSLCSYQAHHLVTTSRFRCIVALKMLGAHVRIACLTASGRMYWFGILAVIAGDSFNITLITHLEGRAKR